MLAQIHRTCLDVVATGCSDVLAVQGNVLLVLYWAVLLLLKELVVLLKGGVVGVQGTCGQLEGSGLAVPRSHGCKGQWFRLLVLLVMLLVQNPSTLALHP